MSERVVLERTFKASLEEVWELWTTKDGFESWWGPEGFRAEVRTLEARQGGKLDYDMIAATPEMVAAMQQMGQPDRHRNRGTFTELRPRTRLVLTFVIDFLQGVPVHESTIAVDLFEKGDRVRMVVTLHGMHDETLSKMQLEGFTSQLKKLEKRFAG